LLGKPLPCLDAAEDIRFDAPWEAKVFSIIVKLSQQGCFTWAEWVDCFSKEVAAADAVEAAGGQPKTYYEQWLAAAETLLVAKGMTSPEQLLAKRFAIGSVGPAHLIAS